ncbi:MAG: hypothetical protein RIR10_1561, partial [Planctomycetota bacterium]
MSTEMVRGTADHGVEANGASKVERSPGTPTTRRNPSVTSVCGPLRSIHDGGTGSATRQRSLKTRTEAPP